MVIGHKGGPRTRQSTVSFFSIITKLERIKYNFVQDYQIFTKSGVIGSKEKIKDVTRLKTIPLHGW